MKKKTMERPEALARGLSKYFTGRKCANGHIDERYTTSGMCRTCSLKRSRNNAGAKSLRQQVLDKTKNHFVGDKKNDKINGIIFGINIFTTGDFFDFGFNILLKKFFVTLFFFLAIGFAHFDQILIREFGIDIDFHAVGHIDSKIGAGSVTGNLLVVTDAANKAGHFE